MDLHDVKTLGRDKEYWWFKGKRELISSILYQFKVDSLKILNIGCGAGEDIDEFSKSGSIISIDYCYDALKTLRSDKRCNMDAQFLGFRDKTFDLVLLLDVLEHIENDKKVLGEIKRVLKTKGHLIITVPAIPLLYGPMDKHECHFRRYSKRHLNKIVSDYFMINKISYWNFLLFIPLAALKLYKKIFFSKSASSDFKKLPRFVNDFFLCLLRIENYLISKTDLQMPIGISLLCIASKE